MKDQDGKAFFTSEGFNLSLPVGSRGKVPAEDEAGGWQSSVSCWRKNRMRTRQTSRRRTRAHLRIGPENMTASFSVTSTLSSQTSETITNMASSFSSSSCFSFADAFTEVLDGPPKKLMLPQYALGSGRRARMLRTDKNWEDIRREDGATPTLSQTRAPLAGIQSR